ncbi:MAG TPA: ABC transporter ATP-binding protein [Syntrophomonadaceae bacterium]|nr:ABC transporter ATP-binding protein [Syntrophomonadaceae bacterium]
MNEILEVRNLSKHYPGFSLKNISFTLEKGYIMGFIGPNGAGKTTTIKLIMNLLRRDSGEIKVFGLDNIKNELEVKERVGFVYDDNHFYNELTVQEMKKIIAPFYSRWDEGVFNDYLDRFELSPRKKIKDLSKGMKMKFSLVIALSHHAELLILDEPTSGLDPIFRSELLDILVDIIQDENKSVFLSTHLTTDLDKIADYITFINQGELVFCESKDEIMERYALVKGGNELLDEELKKEFVGIKQSSYGFTGLTSDIHRARQVFGSSVLFEKATLEDIMLYTVRGESHVQPVN